MTSTLSEAAEASAAAETNAAAEADALRRAFAAVYRQHVDRVYRYLRVRLDSDADAEDLTAQTFISALTSFDSYRGNPNRAANDVGYAPWLLGIARHKAADHFRKRHPAALLPADADDRFADDAPPPDEVVAQHMQIERVAGALRALAPDRAEALALHFFGGLTLAETAAAMGRRETAVRMLISRGLADLRARLNSGEEGG